METGFLVYLWFLMGSLGNLFTFIMVFSVLGFVIYLSIVLIITEGKCVTIKNEKEASLYYNPNSIIFHNRIWKKSQKYIKIWLVLFLISFFIPSRNTLVLIFTADTIVSTVSNISKNENIKNISNKIEKIIDLKIKELEINKRNLY